MRLFLRRHFVIPRGEESGHREQIRTDNRLQLGPPPDKIDRPGDLQRGIIGPAGVNAWPPTGGLQYIGHVPLVHVMRGPVLKSTGLIDEKVSIPAVFAGESIP